MTSDTPLWDLPTNHDIISEHISLEGKRVVDVGAGKGALTRFMRAQGADVIAVECGAPMIAEARSADPEHADSYVEGVGQDLPVDDASADVVIFQWSLHHVPADSMAEAVSEAARALRPGGTLAVLEPIAEGPGFETHRLIDDETIVRAHAQAVLDDQLPGELSEANELRYLTSYSYSGMDELERTVVDVDPARREAFDSVRDEVAQIFEAQAELHGDRYWFAQPGLMRVFTKSL